MTRAEFAKTCSGPLEAAYGPMETSLVEVYFSFLSDLDLPLLSVAVAKCIAELKWLPKIAELRSAAADVVQGQVQEMSASEAWGFAQKAIRRVDFEIAHTIESARALVPPLVWEAIQNSGLRELIYGQGTWPQKIFTDAYNAVLARERKTRLLPPQVRREIESRRSEDAGRLDAGTTRILGTIGVEQ